MDFRSLRRYLVIGLFFAAIAAVGYGVYYEGGIGPFKTRRAELTGVWVDQTGQVGVEIYACAGASCGRIVWLQDPGQTAHDGKRMCGMQVLGALNRTSGTTWDWGWIRNPLDGAQYSAYVESLSNNKLSVTGYLGSRWFGQTFQWNRAPADLKRCD